MFTRAQAYGLKTARKIRQREEHVQSEVVEGAGDVGRVWSQYDEVGEKEE